MLAVCVSQSVKKRIIGETEVSRMQGASAVIFATMGTITSRLCGVSRSLGGAGAGVDSL